MVIRVVVKTELASLHKILTSVPEGRLLLKQQWTVSLKGCIHRGNARCLQRVRRRRAGGTPDIMPRYADNHLPRGACPRHG